jgi:hypothetical protein
MQEPLFPSTITQKLYNERAILIATFVGGPLAGGFLLAENFNRLNQSANAGKTWIATAAALLFLFGSLFIPALDNIPGIVYSFAFCFTAHSIAKKYQGSQIMLHQTNGGQLFSTWRTVGLGLLAMLAMIAVIVGIMFLQDPAIFE